VYEQNVKGMCLPESKQPCVIYVAPSQQALRTGGSHLDSFRIASKASIELRKRHSQGKEGRESPWFGVTDPETQPEAVKSLGVDQSLPADSPARIVAVSPNKWGVTVFNGSKIESKAILEWTLLLARLPEEEPDHEAKVPELVTLVDWQNVTGIEWKPEVSPTSWKKVIVDNSSTITTVLVAAIIVLVYMAWSSFQEERKEKRGREVRSSKAQAGKQSANLSARAIQHQKIAEQSKSQAETERKIREKQQDLAMQKELLKDPKPVPQQPSSPPSGPKRVPSGRSAQQKQTVDQMPVLCKFVQEKLKAAQRENTLEELTKGKLLSAMKSKYPEANNMDADAAIVKTVSEFRQMLRSTASA